MNTSDDKNRLYYEKVDLLTKQVAFGNLATLLTSVPLALIFINITDKFILIAWLSAVLVICVLRFIHIGFYKKYPKVSVHSFQWRLLLYVGLAVSGMLWGISVSLFPPVENLNYLGANALWVCAVIAGAAGSYSFLKRAYFSFSTAAFIPMLVYLSFSGEQQRYVALAISIFFTVMALSSIKLYKIIDDNLKNTLSEKDKNTRISRQKNTLRILSETSESLLNQSWELATPSLLEKLGNCIDVSRIQIFENSYDDNPEKKTTFCKFIWAADNNSECHNEPVHKSYEALGLQRWRNELSSGNPILGNIDSFPENEQLVLHAAKIQSLFVMPIFVGTDWWGFICFDECRKQRNWISEEIDTLKTTAAILGAAIKRSRTEEKLTYHASHDSLTGLMNRRSFEIHLEKLVQSCAQSGQKHVLCYIDLDRFKVVNDTCGHNAGDRLLRQIAEIMQRSVRSRDVVARLGGDEFGLMLENIEIDEAKRVANKLQTSLEKYSFRWDDKVLRIGASFGLVSIDSNSQNSDRILQTADNACRARKNSNTNQIKIYNVNDTDIDNQSEDSQSYVQISQALENDKFTLLFQPITKIGKLEKQWKHFEALIRMQNEDGGLLAPNSFLPTAERYNLINKIDKWVFDKCINLLSKNENFNNLIDLLSINISSSSLCDSSYLRFVTSIFETNEISPQKICFEITETVAVSNLSEANNFIKELRALGCKFALDDFGTGFSSFENLKYLDVDYVKIDGIFVRDIGNNAIDYEMVRSLHKITSLMGISTIAEFVESDEIISILSEIGVDYIQGYAISKPMTLDEVMNTNSKNYENVIKFAS